jgi:hypothetical protein
MASSVIGHRPHTEDDGEDGEAVDPGVHESKREGQKEGQLQAASAVRSVFTSAAL